MRCRPAPPRRNGRLGSRVCAEIRSEQGEAPQVCHQSSKRFRHFRSSAPHTRHRRASRCRGVGQTDFSRSPSDLHTAASEILRRKLLLHAFARQWFAGGTQGLPKPHEVLSFCLLIGSIAVRPRKKLQHSAEGGEQQLRHTGRDMLCRSEPTQRAVGLGVRTTRRRPASSKEQAHPKAASPGTEVERGRSPPHFLQGMLRVPPVTQCQQRTHSTSLRE